MKTALESCGKLIILKPDKPKNPEGGNMDNTETKRISVCVDADIYAQLETIAKKSGVNIISAVIRQAIVFFLAQKSTLLNFEKGAEEEK